MQKSKKQKFILAIVGYLVVWSLIIVSLIFISRPEASLLVTPFSKNEVNIKTMVDDGFMEIYDLYENSRETVDKNLVTEYLGEPERTGDNVVHGVESWEYTVLAAEGNLFIRLEFNEKDELVYYSYRKYDYQSLYELSVLESLGREAKGNIDSLFYRNEAVTVESVLAIFDKPSLTLLEPSGNNFHFSSDAGVGADGFYPDLDIQLSTDESGESVRSFFIEYLDRPMAYEGMTTEVLEQIGADTGVMTKNQVIERFGEEKFESMHYVFPEGEFQEPLKTFVWNVEGTDLYLNLLIKPDDEMEDLFVSNR